MPEEFENGGFTLKAHQMFSLHTSLEELKTQQSMVILDLCLRKTRSGKSRDYRDAIVFEKLLSKCFLSTRKRKSVFSNSSGLKRVFEKLRCRDGLVWMVGLTGEMKLRFQIPPV